MHAIHERAVKRVLQPRKSGLDASMRADADDTRGEPDWTQAVLAVPPPPKDRINIRVDHDVLECFKARGTSCTRPSASILCLSHQFRKSAEART